MQGMFTLSEAPSTTYHLDINILSILHYLGSPLGQCTLIFDLMRNIYFYIYLHCILYNGESLFQILSVELWSIYLGTCLAVKTCV